MSVLRAKGVPSCSRIGCNTCVCASIDVQAASTMSAESAVLARRMNVCNVCLQHNCLASVCSANVCARLMCVRAARVHAEQGCAHTDMHELKRGVNDIESNKFYEAIASVFKLERG